MPRGGKRENSGRKKKPLAEKLIEGNLGKRPIKILEFDKNAQAVNAGDTAKPKIPTAPEFLEAVTRKTDGVPTAKEIFNTLAEWLSDTGCLHLINPSLISDCAINRCAWLECEAANTKHGRIIKSGDGTTAKRSPYVDMAISYYEAYFKAWDKIWAIVSQNSERNYTGFGYDIDPMEALLSGKG